MSKLLVYAGEGTTRELIDDFRRCCTTLRRSSPREVTAADIARGACFKDAAALLIPGGRDLPYCAALNGKGNNQIREFVSNGGAYLGICAGAYYGCERLLFDAGLDSEISGSRELAFFPGQAIGPAFGPGTYDYNSRRGARAVELILADGRRGVTYFNGGCYFQEPFESSGTKILARYSELPDNPPAIVSARVGSGMAVLSGVHAEFDLHRLERADPHEKGLYKRLNQSTDFSLSLIDLLIKEAGI